MVRSWECPLLSEDSVCKKRTETKALLLQKQNKAEEKENNHWNPTIHCTQYLRPNCYSALKQVRQSEKKARVELKKIEDKIHSEPVSISKDLHTSMETVTKEYQLTDPDSQLFWTEQQKAFKSKGKTGIGTLW